ncbi:dullard-like phosphatase [Coniella lustricola]|uniref:Dullard-like phosphatase n=1 Tax=Coniella lustricola TaxID=2025994 RepID=A0A2T3A6R6_9PEZI|nr:dullard-like phosphatase [Coniella lustricola]
MNSLNFVSARVSPASTPGPSRSDSLASMGITVASHEERSTSHPNNVHENDPMAPDSDQYFPTSANDTDEPGALHDEHTPLLQRTTSKQANARQTPWHHFPRQAVSALIDSVRWIISILGAPVLFILGFFCDVDGNFVPLKPLRRLFGADPKAPLEAATTEDSADEKTINVGRGHAMVALPARSAGSSSSALTSESESDADKGSRSRKEPSHGHSRSKASRSSEEINPSRRSIRIKLHNEESLKHRKNRKSQSASPRGGTGGGTTSKDISAQLKSPTSPAGALTKYPRTPAPPRPLIPRRQPSYINVETNGQPPQKTLILDLDETLIHSMSKGGRMSTGHMVEVKLNTTYVGVGGQSSIGPQHPILYYVHKRPHCDDFLRRVCKWFNIVVFTAAVQEYADPVIDWLESERKFFSARYYRQHCTFRHGAFIKDLSSVEPDLSKVMILDNSPLSYMFHQDNAIPIQGWINDPTDNDLQHLIPFLEGLQYVSDVRALLALRGGEDGQHMVP